MMGVEEQGIMNQSFGSLERRETGISGMQQDRSMPSPKTLLLIYPLMRKLLFFIN